MFPLAVHQRRDDVAEGGQREVDLTPFFQSVPRGPSLTRALGPSEIDKVQLPCKGRQKSGKGALVWVVFMLRICFVTGLSKTWIITTYAYRTPLSNRRPAS